MIFKVLSEEEDKFNKTIDQGLNILSDLEEKLNAEGSKILSGEDAFRLYDTYGFPLDLTKEILEEKGFTVDEDGFKKAMDVQREKARSSRKKSNYMGRDDIYQSLDASWHRQSLPAMTMSGGQRKGNSPYHCRRDCGSADRWPGGHRHYGCDAVLRNHGRPEG